MTACPSVSPRRCPICGGPNACEMTLPRAERSAQGCWCVGQTFSAALLQRVPLDAQRKACICPACVKAAAMSDQADA